MLYSPWMVYIWSNNNGPDEKVPSINIWSHVAKKSNAICVENMMIRLVVSCLCISLRLSYIKKFAPDVVHTFDSSSSARFFGAGGWLPFRWPRMIFPKAFILGIWATIASAVPPSDVAYSSRGELPDSFALCFAFCKRLLTSLSRASSVCVWTAAFCEYEKVPSLFFFAVNFTPQSDGPRLNCNWNKYKTLYTLMIYFQYN